MVESVTLYNVLSRYILYHRLSPNTEYSMGRALALFGEWLGREATIVDLTDETVSRWLRDLEQTHAPRTVYGHRTSVLTLWRDCADRDLCQPPHRVRAIHRPKPMPNAWTAEELHKILERIDQLRGEFPLGARRRDYCKALIMVAYDTGLRRSDLWKIKRQAVRPDGTVTVRQAKTGDPHFPQMRKQSLRLFLSLPGDPPLACPYRSDSAWYKFWRRHVIKPAGVRHGCMQQTRRSGATWLAVDHPESVSDYLGHRTPEMKLHYVDQSIAKPTKHMPRSIA